MEDYPRNCYCSLWKKDPEVLINQGVPEGYCGLCEVCGKPGHTRHAPGGRPYTGAWCDAHYEELDRLPIILSPLRFVPMGIVKINLAWIWLKRKIKG